MKKYIIFILSITLLITGSLFFFYQQSWIIISFPKDINQQTTSSLRSVKPQQVELWAFKQQRWIHETTEIIKSDNLAQTIQILLNSWLLFLEEEHIVDGQITVQSIALTPSSNEAFISFHQSPLNLQASTYETCMLIESMLKTLRINQIPLQSVRLLVHHHQLQDDRLNFACSWPITGYMGIR